MLVRGTMTNITWKNFFEEATVTPVGDDGSGISTSTNSGGPLATNPDIGKVRVAGQG